VSVTLTIFLFLPAISRGQRASDEYLPWSRTVEYQSILRKAAADAGLGLKPELVQTFDQLASRSLELLQWARQMDAASNRLAERGRELAAEASARHSERAQLAGEKSDLEAQKQGLESEIRSNPREPSLPGRVEAFNRRLADLQGRIADFNARNEATRRKLAELQSDCDRYDDEALNRYNPQVESWQGQVRAFRAVQLQERERILQHLRHTSSHRPLPEIALPPFRITADRAAHLAIDTTSTPVQVARFAHGQTTEGIAWARQNPEEARQTAEYLGKLTVAGGVAILTGLNPPAGATVRTAGAAMGTLASGTWIVTDIVDAAQEKEARKVKQDEDRARLLANHVQELNAYRHELMKAGTRPEMIGKLLQAKSDELRRRVPGPFSSPDYRLLDDLMTLEGTRTVLKEAVPKALNRGIAQKLGKSNDSAASSEDTPFLDRSRKKPVGTTRWLRGE
jgi:hypothetical protein